MEYIIETFIPLRLAHFFQAKIASQVYSVLQNAPEIFERWLLNLLMKREKFSQAMLEIQSLRIKKGQTVSNWGNELCRFAVEYFRMDSGGMLRSTAFATNLAALILYYDPKGLAFNFKKHISKSAPT